ncbi:hypothetical protein CW700_02145 [Candidatus Bathyarchaeota archaeon]|nr:MAG: hypothetical protein CW700_02145 [Candidatus Bathyarchaeota archaeon]
MMGVIPFFESAFGGGIEMVRMRVAIPTKGGRGLEEVISEVFGRAPCFTLVDLEGGSVEHVEVLENVATKYEHGTGPIVVKMLADRGVNLVVAKEIGPGAKTLLEQNNIELLKLGAGPTVADVLKLVMARKKTS